MELSTLEFIPLILFLVVIVTAIAEKINLPYPLLLVVAGLLVGFIPSLPNWYPSRTHTLEIFLPPILFATARTISWQDIKNYKLTICSLSILLVIISTIAVSFFLSINLSGLTFGTALILGAIISPTDTVAACAIMTRLNTNKKIIKTIEIESLFNDAVGIVLYNAAILFVTIGNKSNIMHISTHTLIVGAGGIGIGALLATISRHIIEKFLIETENELSIIMSLVLAFVAYILAERMGASGVLSVVTAGLMHKNTERKIFAETRLKEKAVWDTLIFFLNGLIFIVIGIQFPLYFHRLHSMSIIALIYYPLLTVTGLFFLRFCWVGLTFTYEKIKKPQLYTYEATQLPLKKTMLVSWAGLKGLVPLALAIALPLQLPNGQPFPNRDLIIYLTITTILFSLLVQGLSLPNIITWLKIGLNNNKEYEKTKTIYQHLTKYSIENMDSVFANHYSTKAKQLIENYYANRLLHIDVKYQSNVEAKKVRLESKKLLNTILQKEREILAKLRTKGDVTEEVYILLLRKLDRDEIGFASYT